MKNVNSVPFSVVKICFYFEKLCLANNYKWLSLWVQKLLISLQLLWFRHPFVGRQLTMDATWY